MGIKEGALALADELEAFEDGDCEECSLYGQPECKGHLSCMESMARYAARKMREAVEHDGENATTVSAYDLLSDEDREALAWVREHGGLDAVEKRLMPAGMEWPKYTDGEMVRIGGCWGEDGCDTSITYIERIIFAEDGVYLENEYHEVFYRHGERVKRPAPKVLDADGEEIREGDVLYSIETGDYVIVDSIEPGNPWFATTDSALQHCAKFTHRAPVLAADGEPLEVGQTVWHVGDGVEFTVIGLPRPGEYQAVKLRLDDGAVTGLDPDQLTHQRPDSWERLEEDAGKNPFDYCEHVGHRLDTCLNAERCKARDLVRRARKLAERGV